MLATGSYVSDLDGIVPVIVVVAGSAILLK
jgi:hypothetical protein